MTERIMKVPDHLSYSNISTWKACPKAWWLNYVYGLPPTSGPALIFGTAAHNSIEDDMLEKTNVAHLAFPLQLHEAYMKSRDMLDMTDVAYEQLTNMGVEILSDPMIQFVISSVDAVAIERKVEFYVPGVPIPVIGYIDFIESDGVPGDIKTSWNDWNYARASAELQPNFYLYAMDKLKIAEDLGLNYHHGGRFRHLVVVKRTDVPRAYIIETVREDYAAVVEEAVRDVWDGYLHKRWLDVDFCNNPKCPCHTHKELFITTL